MKHLRIWAAAAALLVAVAVTAKERKAVIILIDGVPKDAVERLHVPAIYDIAAKGAFGNCLIGGQVGTWSQTPTISAVGYNSMLTGTWAAKHNVYGNGNLSPAYQYWSLFRIAKAQERPLKTGIYSSWTDNRTVLLGEGKEETGRLQIDIVRDGYDLDPVTYPSKPEELHVFDYDERVTQEAEKSIREDAPDLSWVYLWYTDDASHIHGNGAIFDEYILKAGEQIGRIWEAVRYRERHFGEEWMIVVLTDHGRSLDGHSHGGHSARERAGWIATNRKVNRYFKDGKAQIVDVNPSVCEFLGMTVPDEVARERDGISFLGKTCIQELSVMPYDDEAILSWTAVRPRAKVAVYAAADNAYKEGKPQAWKHLGDIEAGQEQLRVSLKELGATKFCKFALVSPHETLTGWLVR